MSRDGRQVAWIRGYFERAADLFDPLTHAQDPEVAGSREVFRSCLQTASVVLNFETHGGRRIRQPNANGRGRSMYYRVADGFSGDQQKGAVGGVSQWHYCAGLFERYLHSLFTADGFYKIV